MDDLRLDIRACYALTKGFLVEKTEWLRYNVMSQKAAAKVNQIRSSLKAGNHNTTLAIFEKLVGDSVLENFLKEVEELASPRHGIYINKHGQEHAINVCHKALELYEKTVIARYIKSSVQDQEQSLLITLVSSYVHDIARWAREHHALIGLAGVDYYLRPTIGIKYGSEDAEVLLMRIKQCIEKHDDLDCCTNTIEEAIVKVADKLDCDKDRVYTKNGQDYSEEEVLLWDKQPQEYFGSKAVELVEIKQGTPQRPIEIWITINSWAAAVPIKTILKALESTKDSGLSGLVEVCVGEV